MWWTWAYAPMRMNCDPLMTHFRLHDRERTASDARHHIVDGSPFLADRYGRRDTRGDPGQAVDIFGAHRRFGEPQSVRFHRLDERDCLACGMGPMHVAGDAHGRTQPFAQDFHLFRDAVVGDRRCEFERRKSLCLPGRGEFCAFGARILRQPGDICRDTIAPLPAEKLADRQSREFAGQIPQGDVDRSERIDVKAAGIAAHPHEVVQIVMDRRRIEGVAANREIRKEIIDDLHRGAWGNQPVGLAPSDGTILGLNAHEHAAIECRIDGPVGLAH